MITIKIKMVKMACGKHYGNPEHGAKVGDPCRKCSIHARALDDGTLQHNGTPWVALLGPALPKPIWWPA